MQAQEFSLRGDRRLIHFVAGYPIQRLLFMNTSHLLDSGRVLVIQVVDDFLATRYRLPNKRPKKPKISSRAEPSLS